MQQTTAQALPEPVSTSSAGSGESLPEWFDQVQMEEGDWEILVALVRMRRAVEALDEHYSGRSWWQRRPLLGPGKRRRFFADLLGEIDHDLNVLWERAASPVENTQPQRGTVAVRQTAQHLFSREVHMDQKNATASTATETKTPGFLSRTWTVTREYAAKPAAKIAGAVVVVVAAAAGGYYYFTKDSGSEQV